MTIPSSSKNVMVCLCSKMVQSLLVLFFSEKREREKKKFGGLKLSVSKAIFTVKEQSLVKTYSKIDFYWILIIYEHYLNMFWAILFIEAEVCMNG